MISDLAEVIIETWDSREPWCWIALALFTSAVVLAFIYIPFDVLLWFI